MQPKGNDSSGPFPLPSVLMGLRKDALSTSPVRVHLAGRRTDRERWESRIVEVTDTRKEKKKEAKMKKEKNETDRGNEDKRSGDLINNETRWISPFPCNPPVLSRSAGWDKKARHCL